MPLANKTGASAAGSLSHWFNHPAAMLAPRTLKEVDRHVLVLGFTVQPPAHAQLRTTRHPGALPGLQTVRASIKVANKDHFCPRHRYNLPPIIRTSPDRASQHRQCSPSASPAPPTESLPHRSCTSQCARNIRPSALPEPAGPAIAQTILRFTTPKEREKTGFHNFTRVWRAMNSLACAKAPKVSRTALNSWQQCSSRMSA